MPDPHEPTGKNVQRKATDKLHGFQSHHILLCSLSVVLPGERHMCIVHIDEPVIGDGDFMRVPPEVFNDLLRTSERALGIHHPFMTKQRIKV